MSTQMNIAEARTHFSKIIEMAVLGEEVVIAKAGRPVAKVVPIRPRVEKRNPGSAKGKVWVASDFDAPIPG